MFIFEYGKCRYPNLYPTTFGPFLRRSFTYTIKYTERALPLLLKLAADLPRPTPYHVAPRPLHCTSVQALWNRLARSFPRAHAVPLALFACACGNLKSRCTFATSRTSFATYRGNQLQHAFENKWNIWNINLQHTCETIVTHGTSRSTLQHRNKTAATFIWNSSNT